MKSVEESIAEAMDCENISILPFLPYILQDFWEIGSSAKSILRIVKENTKDCFDLNVLDLGCGKGAVSIKLAIELKCTCLGIDAIQDFIDIANNKAKQNDIADKCQFVAGDARDLIRKLGQYDVIILGSIGPVFGNYFETMSLLKRHLNENGIIVLDDGYLEDDSIYKHELTVKKSVLLEQLDNAGTKLLKEYVGIEVDKSDEYESEFHHIVNRCNELAIKYPENQQLFEDYIQKQKTEYESLENEIICSTMVIGQK